MPKRIDRTGEIHKATSGLTMTIVRYRNNHDIDVQFEDEAIAEHKTYNSFLQGKIRHPDYSSYTAWRVGETNTANNGQKMKIICYRDACDIDIEFEDGSLVLNKSYAAFKRGQIINPNIQYDNGVVYLKSKVGQSRIAKNGQKMTIIAYRRYSDIDVQFENGLIISNIGYNAFKRGEVRDPNIYSQNKENRLAAILSDKYPMHNGLCISIINYRNSRSVDVQFETGFIRYNVRYDTVKAGMIKHIFPYQLKNIQINAVAYVHDGIGNFYCKCQNCGHKDIMTVSEMQSHICNI